MFQSPGHPAQQLQFTPVAGHPWVVCAVTSDCYAPARIHCRCAACGDYWQKECNYPERAHGWTLRYAAQHSHGNEPLRRAFSDAFVREQQRAMMALRGR
jgi:hypothetical protein